MLAFATLFHNLLKQAGLAGAVSWGQCNSPAIAIKASHKEKLHIALKLFCPPERQSHISIIQDERL